jgi:hypothetical protein
LIKAGCNSLWFCRASEIEQFDLWPVVKEISQWSIREIRAENFDPAYENLLPAVGREGWELAPPGVTVEGERFHVPLSPDRTTTLSAIVRFRPIAHLPVSSLSIGITAHHTGPATLQTPPKVQLTLKYGDGETEIVERDLSLLKKTPVRSEVELVIATDFDRHVLSEATITFVLPPGEGSLVVENPDTQRDLLVERSL